MNKKEQLTLVKKALWLRFAIIAFSLFLVDIATKFLFKKPSFQTSGHFVDITFMQNTGTMWSLFQSVQAINVIFIVFSILALAAIIYIFKEYFSRHYALALGFIAGGILGNLHDRIFHAAVTDWINFHFWPVFNIADASIVVGVILVLWFFIKDARMKK